MSARVVASIGIVALLIIIIVFSSLYSKVAQIDKNSVDYSEVSRLKSRVSELEDKQREMEKHQKQLQERQSEMWLILRR